MDTSIFIALINPGMSLVFAAAFFLLWHHERHRRYILALGLAFVAVACGFLLQYFEIYSLEVSKLASNLFFLAGGIGMAMGALARYDRKPPLRAVMVIASLGFATFAWFLFMAPHLSWRIYAINFSFGAITLTMAVELRSVAGRKLIDNLLLGLVTFWGVSFFVRPVVVMWIDGPYVGYDNFHQSLYWITLVFSAALFSVLFALTLVTAVALDVMEELKRESQTDPLSGLLNRRGFEEGMAAALGSARRKGLPAALVVCDLDHFKAINDTWGHSCGDSVIAAFAGCLRAGIGPNHVAGRVGGEEFAILLKGANATAARLFAEGVRTAFGGLTMPGLPDHVRCTGSFGVAEWQDEESIASLFARADAALYEAKKAGRDRVRLAAAPCARDGQPPIGAIDPRSATRH